MSKVSSKQAKNELWLTETGWSSPRASTLSGKMKFCNDWSTIASFRTSYENFLAWDMNAHDEDQIDKAPDKAFFFTIRDSTNFGLKEGFGLIESCSEPKCKLATKTSIAANMLPFAVAV